MNTQQEIRFDVAVAVGRSRSDELKPRIKVLGLELSGGMENRSETNNVSRVSFSVPVALPATAVLDANVQGATVPSQ